MLLLSESAWFKVDGTSELAISDLQRAAGVPLPGQYIQFLRYSNGGEGDLPF